MGGMRKPRGGRVTPKRIRTKPSRYQVFAYLCNIGGPLIREAMGAYCCVPSSRIAAEVLNHFGISAECVPVKLQVLRRNQAFWIHGTGELSYENGQLVGWDGHLIVIAESDEGDELLDLTIEQANRPEVGIVLRPVWADLSPHFASDGISSHEISGSLVQYGRITSNNWRQLPRSKAEKRLVRQMIQEIQTLPQ